MGEPGESRFRESKKRFWLTFVLHQFIGIWGIFFSAGDVTTLAFATLGEFGRTYSREYFYWVLAGRPYFPIHISLALFLGWAFGRHLWHRSMVWIWVLPFCYLCYAFFAISTLTPNSVPAQFQAGVGETRFSHYFGWGCGPWNHCIDQFVITLPFYISAAYSLGALCAFKFSPEDTPIARIQRVAVGFVGTWFFIAAAHDLYASVKSTGWHWIFIPYESVAGGIGIYLLLLAFFPMGQATTSLRVLAPRRFRMWSTGPVFVRVAR